MSNLCLVHPEDGVKGDRGHNSTTPILYESYGQMPLTGSFPKRWRMSRTHEGERRLTQDFTKPEQGRSFCIHLSNDVEHQE